MSQRIANLRYAYTHVLDYVITLLASLLIAMVMFGFTDIEMITANEGALHGIAIVVLQIIISLLFGLNVNLLWHKIKLASFSKRATGASSVGAFLAILVGGCPACSITIASYLGLAGVLGFAFSGILLKVIGLGLMVYSTDYLLKNLTVCKQKKYF